MQSTNQILKDLKIEEVNQGTSTGSKWYDSNEHIVSLTPIDGSDLAKVSSTTLEDFKTVVNTAENAFQLWRKVPAPKRGDIVRQIGDRLRQFKEPLGTLVSYEMGKSLQVYRHYERRAQE